VAPNGGTVSRLPRQPAAGCFRVVWAGGARWPWQALDLVLEGARLARQRVPELELSLYTEAGHERVPREAGIVLAGQVPHADLAGVLARMDAALCLYRPMPWSPAGFYNSPLKLFDYLAAGLAVVGSRLGQIAEVIEDGTSGLLVGDSASEVAAALERLARDRALTERLGAAGLRRLETEYTWNHTGDRIGAVLETLLASGKNHDGRPQAA